MPDFLSRRNKLREIFLKSSNSALFFDAVSIRYLSGFSGSNSALLIAEDAKNDLFPSVISLLNEQETARIIAANCLTLGVPNAAERIVNEIENII